jgi:hypothetical protein
MWRRVLRSKTEDIDFSMEKYKGSFVDHDRTQLCLRSFEVEDEGTYEVDVDGVCDNIEIRVEQGIF